MRELILLALFCGAFSSVIFDQRYDLAIDNYEDIQTGGLEEVEMLLSVEKYVFFLLYTKKNPLISQKLEFNVDGIENSNYDKLKNTKFIIHGWRNDGGSRINVLIRDAYLKSFDVNVIVVDWGQVAHSINYKLARDQVTEVGTYVAKFIDFLNEQNFTKFDQIHIAGHSLGAHISGIAGKLVSRGKIQSIVAMDPAAFLFTSSSDSDRFAADDAVYTEAIITNGATLGFFEPIAQATFYPNYGQYQPNCGDDTSGACSHSRSFELMADSIRDDTFWASKCGSFDEIDDEKCVGNSENQKMGGEPGNFNKGVTGVFYLETKGEVPFSKGPRKNKEGSNRLPFYQITQILFNVVF